MALVKHRITAVLAIDLMKKGLRLVRTSGGHELGKS